MLLAIIEQRSHNLFPLYSIFYSLRLLPQKRNTQNSLPHRKEPMIAVEKEVGCVQTQVSVRRP
jgi:hypothetical protein